MLNLADRFRIVEAFGVCPMSPITSGRPVDARFCGRLALWTSGGTNVAAFFRGAYQTQVGLASSSSEIFRAMA